MRKQELHPRTESINKKQKLQSKKAKEDALQWLALKFPHAFDNTLKIQPLKAGIMVDILAYADEAQAAGISKSKLREAVVVFTRRIDYLTSLKAKETRIDLLGNTVIPVTEQEAEHATLKIKKRVEKSAKIARQNTHSKTLGTVIPKPTSNFNSQEEPFPYYTDKGVAWSNAQPQTKTTSVVVKNTTARQYDPEAVARLKEKLGLSRAGDKEMTK